MDRSQRVVDIVPDRGLFDLGLRELLEAREVVWRFALRGLTLRYRQTALGVLWVVLQPLLASGVLAVVFGTFAGLSGGERPYLLVVYAGLLPFMLFAQSIQRGGAILVSDRNLVTKTWLPRMALPLSSIVAVCVDVAVALACFVPLALALGVPPTLRMLAIPLLMLPLLALCTGAVLAFAALNAYYRDVQQTVPLFLQLAFFATPIGYLAERTRGPFAEVIRWNPLSAHVEAFRWALLGSGELPRAHFVYASCVSCGALLLGAIVFRRAERALADVI